MVAMLALFYFPRRAEISLFVESWALRVFWSGFKHGWGVGRSAPKERGARLTVSGQKPGAWGISAPRPVEPASVGAHYTIVFRRLFCDKADSD